MTDTTHIELAMAERETPLILVVDDDVVIRRMLKKALQNQAYDVVEAPNGSEGVELFRKLRPDMVLLDVLMPMMDGFEACDAMRKMDPERTVPIIMLTGLDDVTSVERSFDVGATDFITKPVNWSLFSQRVRYSLRTRDMDFALRKNQLRIRHALQVARLGYWDWDVRSDYFYLPPGVLEMLGVNISGEKFGFAELLPLVAEEDRDRVQQAFMQARDQGQRFELRHRIVTSSHTERYVYQQAEVVVDDEGRTRYVMGTIQDITAMKRAEDMILHQAFHDQLTDLPNQALLSDRLAHALKVAEQSGHKVAILVIDIDRFQLVNESLGHDAGSMLLVLFAEFLHRFVQDGDTISRISGNEFAIMLESLPDIAQLHDMIRNIRQALHEKAFELLGEKIYLSVSMGVALFPDDSVDAEQLIKCANAAMRKAKAQGGNQEYFYTTDMNRRVHDRLRMENDLRIALDNNALELHYQPQVDTATRKIIGMEALVRWQHPEYGLIPPIRFIPLAEETGLIRQLGSWVLEEAIRQTGLWAAKGYVLRVGINLSARQFAQDDLLNQVPALLQAHGLNAKFVDLEITETIAMQDADNSIRKLHQLKELGVNLSMDDFGTGYSSLSYLHQFPLDVLKIDRSFVKDIGRDGNNGAIAKAVIAMAHSMGLEVIAEGVETEMQYAFLNKHGCQMIQGYLISRPLLAEQFEELLKK
ncbi:MAG: hypothetical protein QG652_394 [Pseudomonadota bacterium]|nr:hypothetical protein [Pseudomonadota bacterium]